MITLTEKEVDALAWILKLPYVDGSLTIGEFRDEADVGWLRVRVGTKRGGGRWLRPPAEKMTFVVSPLGHVYAGEWSTVRRGELVREGPPLK